MIDESGIRHLEGPALSATFDARRGGKITSLVDSAGYDWLLGPGPLQDGRGPRGSDFLDAGLSGWDECAPTVVACTLADGRDVPDHGDLWNVVWSCEANAMSATSRSSGVLLRRTATSTGDGLRLEYSAATSSEHPQAFLWLAHPLFRAPAGSSVVLNGAPTVVDVLSRPTRKQAWTPRTAAIDDVAPGTRRKLYVAPGDVDGCAALDVPGHGRLVMRWDPEEVPYVALWLDQCSLTREPVIAIEPCTGYYDSLASAMDAGRVSTVARDRPLAWSLDISLVLGDAS